MTATPLEIIMSLAALGLMAAVLGFGFYWAFRLQLLWIDETDAAGAEEGGVLR